MFSLTLRTMPEAKLPKAARHSCVRAALGQLQGGQSQGGHLQGVAPLRGWYRGAKALTAASRLGTSDCAISICVERPFQNPEARP